MKTNNYKQFEQYTLEEKLDYWKDKLEYASRRIIEIEHEISERNEVEDVLNSLPEEAKNILLRELKKAR